MERLEAEAAWLVARLKHMMALEKEFSAAVALHKALSGTRHTGAR